MIFSKNHGKNLLGFFFSAAMLVSCSENNEPQIKGPNNSTFYVDAFTAKFSTVGEANAQGKQSKKLISFEACLKDNAQTNSVSNLKFDILAGEAKANKVSDYRGCLVWYELLDFDPEGEVKNIFMTREVVATESHSGTEKLVFNVNPYKDTFEFNRHGSTGGQQSPVSYKLSSEIRTSSISEYDFDIYVKVGNNANGILSPIQRQTEISTLKLKFQSIDYRNLELDANLNLTFPYIYKTSLAIDLIRQDFGDILAQKIKRGNFMFNLVFLKESTKINEAMPSDVVAAVMWNAKPRGDAGLIEKEIQVKFSNIAAMTSRMKLLLTITSTDSPILFADQSYSGIVTGVTANGNLEVELTLNENSAKDLVEKFETVKSQKIAKTLSAKQIIESEGFSPISSPEEIKFNYKKGFWGKPVETNVNLSAKIENLHDSSELSDMEEKAICEAFFKGSKGVEQALRDCLVTPSGVLKAEVRDFITEVNTKPVNITFLPKELLKISAKFDVSQEKVKKSGYNLAGSVGANLDGGFSAKAGACSSPLACGEGLKTDPKKPGKWAKGKGLGANIGLGATFGLSGQAHTAQGLEKIVSDKKEVTVETSQEVTAQPMVIRLSMKTSKCLLIVPSEDYIEGTKTVNMPSKKYFCNKPGTQVDFNEHFFLMDHKNVGEDSAVVDKHSSVVNTLRMLVRGQKPYEFLKGILTSEKFAYKFYLGMNAEQITDDPTNFMTQEAPLMLSSTRKVLLGNK